MKNWIAQRYKLLTKIKKRITESYGGESISLRAYSRHLREFFEASHFRKCDERDFFEALADKQVDIVVGTDFHSYIQNQKAHARILRKLERPLILALECFRSTDQSLIHQYMSAEIGEEEFLDRIGWNENWGFPWKSYKQLVDLAIERNWKVIGINRSTKGRTSHDLLKRDQWMARSVAQAFTPNTLIYVIVGELHAAPSCLAAEMLKLKSSLRILSLFVNPDPLLESSNLVLPETASQFYKVDKEHFALVNSSALAKWQSYLIFLEAQDQSFDEEFFELDVSEHVTELAKILIARLNLQINSRELSVFTDWSEVPLATKKRAGASLKREIAFAKKFGEVSFGEALGLSHSLNFNHLCELAAYSVLPPMSWQNEPALEKRIWIHIWSYFYSKMLNPHRKSRSLEELLKSKSISYSSQLKMLALSMSLRISALRREPKKFQNHYEKLKMNDEEKFLAALLLGELYGGFVFDWFRENQSPIEFLYELSQQDMRDENFLEIFINFVGQVMESNAERLKLQVVV